MLPQWQRSLSPNRMPRPGRSRFTLALYAAFSIALFLLLFVYSPLPNTLEQHRDDVVSHVSGGLASDEVVYSGHRFRPATLANTKSKHAFATFLAGDQEKPGQDINDDTYFVAARILTYQLLHAPETKSDVPFIVMVTPKVSQLKRERLQLDGAIVIEAEDLHADDEWIHPAVSSWADVMLKLRLWGLTQFERIAFLDADTLILKPMDGVFDDPAVAARKTTSKPAESKSDEAALPSNFVFAGVPEMKHEHAYPPTFDDYPNINYLNAGFFVLAPSKDMLAYYTSLVSLKGRFNTDMPEQNLLNYAHRREGNMPWQQLGTQWNIHYPTTDDAAGGVHSLHEKWWVDVPGLTTYMQNVRWRMEGYYDGREEDWFTG